MKPYRPQGKPLAGIIELGAPEILLTLSDGITFRTHSRWEFDRETPLHLRLYFRVSEEPSVIRTWLLPRSLLRAFLNSMPHEGTTLFVVLEHPDNGALVRITSELEGMSVDVDRRGLIATLNLLDEKYPLDKIQGVDVDAFLLDLESSMGYDFFTPVTLGISIERAVSVHRLNQALTASVPLELPCRLRRDINDPARLVIEILSGQTELAIRLDIARVADAVSESMLRAIGYELPAEGLRVGLDAVVIQVPDFMYQDPDFDGTDEHRRDASIILRVSSALSPLADFDLLLPAIVLDYFRLLAKQWASEQGEFASATPQYFAHPETTGGPQKRPEATAVDVTTDAEGRPHPFAKGDLVQYRQVGMYRRPGLFTVTELAWALTDGHPRMRLLDAEGKPALDNIWFRADSFELVHQ